MNSFFELLSSFPIPKKIQRTTNFFAIFIPLLICFIYIDQAFLHFNKDKWMVLSHCQEHFLNPLATIFVSAAIFMFFQNQAYKKWYIIRKNDYEQLESSLNTTIKKAGLEKILTVEPLEKGNLERDGKSWRTHLLVKSKLKYAYNFYSEYYQNVHFEITIYPKEICYGVHLEMDKLYKNQIVRDVLVGILKNANFLSIEPSDLIRRPEWIFLVKSIVLEGDFIKDMPVIKTHCQHFTELVFHCHEEIYSEQTVKTCFEALKKDKRLYSA